MLKTTICSPSRMFWDKEEELKELKQRDKNDDDKTSQVETKESRDLYLGMLEGMSQELGHLCYDLQVHGRLREVYSILFCSLRHP
jgi:hypothetical protein